MIFRAISNREIWIWKWLPVFWKNFIIIKSMKELIDFIKSQRLLTLATSDASWPWTSNVYYGYDNGLFYFISWKDTKHSQHIIANYKVSFSTAWFSPNDYTDRKSIQWIWTCTVATSIDDISKGISLHNKSFPEFAERITVDWVLEDENRAIRMIRPTQIKFWNDELYGPNWTKLFEL